MPAEYRYDPKVDEVWVISDTDGSEKGPYEAVILQTTPRLVKMQLRHSVRPGGHWCTRSRFDEITLGRIGRYRDIKRWFGLTARRFFPEKEC